MARKPSIISEVHRRPARLTKARLLFTGGDHFINASTRYVPMIPDILTPMALPLVHLSGLAELADWGAVSSA